MRTIAEIIVGVLCCIVVVAIFDLLFPSINLQAKNYYSASLIAGGLIFLFSVGNPAPKKTKPRGNYKPLGNHD